MLNKLFNTVNVTIYYINGTESDTFGKDILLRYWEVITLSGVFFYLFDRVKRKFLLHWEIITLLGSTHLHVYVTSFAE